MRRNPANASLRDAAKTPARGPLARVWVGEEGVSTVEYALVLALLAAACIGAVTFLTNAMAANYQRVGASLH